MHVKLYQIEVLLFGWGAAAEQVLKELSPGGMELEALQ